METFDITSMTDKDIVLTKHSDLETVYNLLQKDENFIVRSKEKTSTIIIAANLNHRVKAGELTLSAKEGGNTK